MPGMVTYAELVQSVVGWLAAHVGDGYDEIPGQNVGPYRWDCQGLAAGAYESVGLTSAYPGIGAIGSRAQYWNSKVKCPMGAPLRAGQQVFFAGADPPFGHTGIVTGVFANGTYEMVLALDYASGVCYSTFDAIPNGVWQFEGATDPLSYLARYNPFTEAPMLIKITAGATGQFTIGSFWEYVPGAKFDAQGNGTVQRLLCHVATPAEAAVLENLYGSVKTMTGMALMADVAALNLVVVVNS